MKIANVARDDWANFAWDNAQALKSVGEEVRCMKLKPHKNEYPQEGELVSEAEMKKVCEESDIVQIFFSNDEILNIIGEHPCIVVYHCGSTYRKYSDHYNKIFNPVVKMSIIALGEFDKLGSFNQRYLVGAIDTNKIQPHYTARTKKRIIGHYPSNVNKKGTKKIMAMIREIKDPFEYKGRRVTLTTWEKHMKRIAELDVYIELFKQTLEGRPYGSWGITALEAACLGKIVITNHRWDSVYRPVYGYCGLYGVNTDAEFYKAMHRCIRAPQDKILQWQHDARTWVEKHNYKNTGTKLMEYLNELC